MTTSSSLGCCTVGQSLRKVDFVLGGDVRSIENFWTPSWSPGPHLRGLIRVFSRFILSRVQGGNEMLPGVCRVAGREACHAWVGKVRAEPEISLVFFLLPSTQVVEHVNNPRDQTEGRVDSRVVC